MNVADEGSVLNGDGGAVLNVDGITVVFLGLESAVTAYGKVGTVLSRNQRPIVGLNIPNVVGVCDGLAVEIDNGGSVGNNGLIEVDIFSNGDNTALFGSVYKRSGSTALDGRKVDYLIVSHLEPDHAGSIGRLVELFPEVTLVGNAKTFQMLPQFFDELPVDENHKITVAEGESLSLGTHTLNFYMAPMVHWPEVMVTYESSEKILFSADGFGKFGALDYEDPEGVKE